MSLSQLHADIAQRYSALNQSISKGTIKADLMVLMTSSDVHVHPGTE